MAKVYVSSTFKDLEECRRQVSLALRRMGHEDVAMEYYVAEDKRPVDRCLADVAACDLYIGIFAWRYGYVPEEDNPDRLSITEMEYRQAVKTGKPCLIFLLHDEAPWLPKFVDRDRTRIDALRDELSKKYLCAHFKSAEDIGSVVAPAVVKWAQEHGFIAPVPHIPELDPAPYFAALTKRYQRLDLEGLTPPQKEEYLQLQLRSVFVEQSVRENPPPVELPKEVWAILQSKKEVHPDDLPEGVTLEDVRRAREAYYEKPSRPVLDVLTDPRHQHVIILGDPGSGKSTLSRYLLLSLIDPTGDEKLRRVFEGTLPLLIELRTCAGARADNKCDTFLEFLEYMGRTEGWHLNKDALDHFMKSDPPPNLPRKGGGVPAPLPLREGLGEGNNRRAVVIFDGLDEIFDPADRELVTRQIVGFASDYPKARVVVTSRVIGYRRKILTDAGFAHFTLQDLDEKQVATFVERWYALALNDRPDEAQERRERILRSFRESASIRQLAGNPMLLTIMAIIGKHQELPRERWKLYDHAASVLIQHWDVNKHLKDRRVDADFIGEDDKKELLRRLAFRMQNPKSQRTQGGNYIPRDELEMEIESYLKDRYSLPPDRAVAIARAMIEQFRERNFILCRYGANLYGFVHRAFLEYFCAAAFVHKFEKSQEMTLDQLKREVYGAHWEDQSWHEVLRLICGMIDEKWAGNIIDYLVNEGNQSWSGELDLPGSIWLAMMCLREVRNHNSVAEPAKRLSSLLRDRAINDVHEVVRLNAIGALASFFHDDPQTLPLLHDRAVNDAHGHVRYYALKDLAFFFHDDPQTLPLLHDRAVNDDYDPPEDERWATSVRLAAVEALIAYFPDDAQTSLLLHDRAVNDADQNVRRAAVIALAEHYYDDSQTLLLLRDWAINSSHTDVRRAAITALALFFRDDPQTLPLLHDRTTNDTNAWVRLEAIFALAEHYRDDPQTLPLLRERAENDSSLVAQETVKELLDRLSAAP